MSHDENSPEPSTFNPYALPELNVSPFMSLLGIAWTSATPTDVRATVNLSSDHFQPLQMIHGGVLCAIAEEVASVAGTAAVLENGQACVGVNNSTDFLRPGVVGQAHIHAWPIYQGRTQQLWAVEISSAETAKVFSHSQVRLHNIDFPKP